MIRKKGVGSEVDSYCGRCKMVLNHMITAMVEDVPRRVRCLTCSSEHNHKVVKPKTTRRASKGSGSARSVAAAKAAAVTRWNAAMNQWNEATSKPYSIYDSFEVEDLISHSKFGPGVVIEVAGPTKIITLFEAGEKMLMHGRERSN